jgi:hypothetical protein
VITQLASPTKVARVPDLPLSPQKLDELDGPVRPGWLPATVSRRDGVLRLYVEPLYWGVRQLVRTIATDENTRPDAIAFLNPWHSTAAYTRESEVQSSTPTVVYTTGRHSLEQTLRPVSVGSLHLESGTPGTKS